MTIPSRQELHDEVDRRFFDAHQDAPPRLDPDDPDHQVYITAWLAIRDDVVNQWTNDVFFAFFPAVGRLDPDNPDHAQFIDYWIDIRDQIRDDAPPKHVWDAAPEPVANAGADTTTSDSSSASSSASSSEGHALHTVRFWVKAFIPQYLLSAPPGYDCFLGDNRSYSSDPAAPCRLHSEVVIRNIDTGAPTMEQNHWCGVTRQVDCDTEAEIATAIQSTERMSFYNLRYSGAIVNYPDSRPADEPPIPAGVDATVVGETSVVSVDYRGAANDPLVPAAPDVDMWLHIELDTNTGVLTVSGAVDDYPAFEGYATVNEHADMPLPIFEADGEDWVISLVGAANRAVFGSVELGGIVASYG